MSLPDWVRARGLSIFLTGVQALVRLPLMQHRLDQAAGRFDRPLLHGAVDVLEKAVGRDPGFHAAWVQLAKANAGLCHFNWDRTEERLARAKVAELFLTEHLTRVPVDGARQGDLVAVAGIEDIYIGETLADPENPVALPVITVDEPALSMTIGINTSPLAGREGKKLTARLVKNRLDAELVGKTGSFGNYTAKIRLRTESTEELRQLQMTATVFPTIFLGVAAFLLNVVLARLIGTQRDQIGILKAFGYSNLAVGVHYVKLALAVVLVGVVGGVGLGAWLGRALSAVCTASRYRRRSHCTRGPRTAGPLRRLRMRNWIPARSAARAIAPPSASISLTRCPFARPPMAGLHDICPIVSRFMVRSNVFRPPRAVAWAASAPASPKETK